MERDKLKDLDEYINKVGIPQLLLRVIVAYALVYTKNYDIFFLCILKKEVHKNMHYVL